MNIHDRDELLMQLIVIITLCSLWIALWLFPSISQGAP